MSLVANGTGVAASAPDGLTLAAGTVSSPSVRLVPAETTTGFYSPGANQVALASAGVQSWLVSATGAHTFGMPSGGGVTHSFRSGAQTLLNVTSAAGSLTRIALADGVNNDIYLRRDGGAASGFSILSDTTLLASSLATGAWTFGPASGTPATVHTVYGSLSVRNGNDAVVGNNFFLSASNARDLVRYDTTRTGSAIIFGMNTGATGIGLSFWSNQPGDSASTAADLIGFATNPGAWTLGADSGLTARHTIRNSSATTGDSVLRLEKLAVAAGTANTLYLEFYGSGGGNDGNISNNGAGALTLVDASDARLKTNVRDASYGLSTILALRPVEFDWLTGGANVKGFIAQEVAPILPESVVVREANGLPDMHFLETQTMIPVLVKAIQELEARLAALEGA